MVEKLLSSFEMCCQHCKMVIGRSFGYQHTNVICCSQVCYRAVRSSGYDEDN